MKNLLSLLKKQLSNSLFIFAILFVIGIIAFVLSPTFKDSSAPIGVWGWIGTIAWMLIPILFFGGKLIYILFKK